jgi:hypothetical protein
MEDMSPSPPDVIHHYEIPVDGQPHRFTLNLGMLHFGCRQAGIVEFWTVAPTTRHSIDRTFIVVGTGHPFPPAIWHVGTVLAPGGLVWHILEVSNAFEDATKATA